MMTKEKDREEKRERERDGMDEVSSLLPFHHKGQKDSLSPSLHGAFRARQPTPRGPQAHIIEHFILSSIRVKYYSERPAHNADAARDETHSAHYHITRRPLLNPALPLPPWEAPEQAGWVVWRAHLASLMGRRGSVNLVQGSYRPYLWCFCNALDTVLSKKNFHLLMNLTYSYGYFCLQYIISSRSWTEGITFLTINP